MLSEGVCPANASCIILNLRSCALRFFASLALVSEPFEEIAFEEKSLLTDLRPDIGCFEDCDIVGGNDDDVQERVMSVRSRSSARDATCLRDHVHRVKNGGL